MIRALMAFTPKTAELMTMRPSPGRARTDSDAGVESTSFASARGDINPGNLAAANTEGDEASELLTLLRGVVGRLDKLEESQAKLEQRLEPLKKNPKALVNTRRPWTAGPDIDSLGGTPHAQTPRRPPAPPQYFGLRNVEAADALRGG
ncbi:hypothetical protein PR003_g12843 [Phytophthora rubi]|uniref:Uncharacterized protein n=1 Tax=Phytophthora rubi TaxID=129364 RepID=A0A6A4FJ53_9STRA|nr:hypothetical protein PR003_g12843 [Phytophthora rubi]